MKDAILPVSIIVAALLATFLHHLLKNQPIMSIELQGLFYEQTGLTIGIPEGSRADVYADYVVVERPDGVATVVPAHRIHAIEGVAR